MSSHRLGLNAFVCLAFLAGCPDPRGAFDDFDERVPDAAEVSQIDGMMLDMLPDITGRFLLGISPGFLPDRHLRFFASPTLEINPDGTGTLTLVLQAASAEMCAPPESGTPVGPELTFNNITVNTAGEFVFTTDMQVMIDAEANSISCGAILLAPSTTPEVLPALELRGRLISEDRFCGLAGGHVMSPIDTSLGTPQSTFGAIRIGPTDVGSSLPVEEVDCPAPMPDGGVPDAPVDAGVPDAEEADAP